MLINHLFSCQGVLASYFGLPKEAPSFRALISLPSLLLAFLNQHELAFKPLYRFFASVISISLTLCRLKSLEYLKSSPLEIFGNLQCLKVTTFYSLIILVEINRKTHPSLLLTL
jgi:hypothetical protein